MRMRRTWFFTSKNASRVHSFPESFVNHTPSPGAVLPRMSPSPPAAQTMSGFDSATATAPIVPPKNLSVALCQLMPPSVVLKTPPPVVPIQYSYGRLADPATATERPPRYGPISRHRRLANAVVSNDWAAATAGSRNRAQPVRIRRGNNMVTSRDSARPSRGALNPARRGGSSYIQQSWCVPPSVARLPIPPFISACTMSIHRVQFTSLAVIALAACSASPTSRPASASLDEGPRRLPTGRTLDPAGVVWPVGSMPLAMTLSPSGREVVVLLNGWREQGVQVVDRASGRVVQTLPQAAAFLGLAFSPDGRTLYVSGGNQDVVYRYAWANARAQLTDSIIIEPKAPQKNGRRYPAGLALSPDGSHLYVAENLTDSLAVVDLATAAVVQRFGVERYPYGVVVDGEGTVYVSSWGGSTVSSFSAANGRLTATGRMNAGRHPSAMLLSRDGSRLFVASGSTDRVTVLETRRRRAVTSIIVTPPGGPGEGATPNALALSEDGKRLFVAEADNNAVAIVDLAATTAGVSGATGADPVSGRVPVEWYPTAVMVRDATLLTLTGKGRGTGPNLQGPQPDHGRADAGFDARQYTLGQTTGSLVTATVARAGAGDRCRD